MRIKSKCLKCGKYIDILSLESFTKNETHEEIINHIKKAINAELKLGSVCFKCFKQNM